MADTFFAEEELILSPEEQETADLVARLRLIDAAPLKRMVDEFRDGTEIGRLQAEKCRRYYDGDQLDPSKVTALRRARQPRVIRNEIKPAINGLLGILQQAKVDPRAWPRNPNNEDQADVASKALRYVADVNRFHKTKIDVAENHLIEGVAAAIVEADERTGAVIHRIRYDEIIYDPRSREANFSDALYKGVGKWLYEQDVQRLYPHLAEDIGASFETGWGADLGLGTMYEDKPDTISGTSYWMDRKKRRLFIVELYHREDQWMRTVFYVGGVLEQDVSPYLDDYDEPICPIVMGSCFIDRDNQRYGLVASMLSPQDELNAYTSRALHLANHRQLMVSDPDRPPEVDARTASQEAAKADGVIPFGYSPVPTNDLLQSISLMMADARQALVRQAPTPAVLADASGSNESGRSRLVLQQAGMTEIARAMGRLEDWENEVYRQAWLRLKQFKTEPWWIRITGDEGRPEFAGVNIPVGPDGQPIDPRMAQMMAMQGQPVQITNRLADMDVDIEVETVPDTANLQAEQFEAIAPLLPQIAEAYGPAKSLELALALSSIPDKGRVKSILDAEKDNPQAAQMAQMQQQLQQMQAELGMRKAQADIAKTESDAELNRARARKEEASVVIDAAELQQKSLQLANQQEPQY